MDHQTFDRLTYLFAASGSRRNAWRALLGAALLGATTQSAAAAPCSNGKHLCGGTCCPGKCFTDGSCEVCCTGENIICTTAGGPVCCLNLNDGKDPCAVLQATGKCPTPDPGPNPSTSCKSGIAGSYRRR
jgi:hypothetical protein